MICVRLKIRRTKVPIKWPLIGQNDEHWILGCPIFTQTFFRHNFPDGYLSHRKMEDKSGASLQRGRKMRQATQMYYFIPFYPNKTLNLAFRSDLYIDYIYGYIQFFCDIYIHIQILEKTGHVPPPSKSSMPL